MLDMNVDQEKLTAMLPSCLAAIVPAGFRVEAASGMGPDIASPVVLACEPVPLGALTS
jgi:hypothetical protein